MNSVKIKEVREMPKLNNGEFSALFTKLALTLPNKLGAAEPLIDLGIARYGEAVFGNLFILMGFQQDLRAGKVRTRGQCNFLSAFASEDRLTPGPCTCICLGCPRL